MNRIFNFLKRNVWYIVWPLVGGVWGASVAYSIIGGLSGLAILLMQVSWLVAAIAVVGLAIQLKTEDARIRFIENKISGVYQDLFDQANSILEQASGYNEQILEEVAIYSKMKQSGVFAPVANAIIALAQEADAYDTMFLIRLSHREGTWYLKMAGRQAHTS